MKQFVYLLTITAFIIVGCEAPEGPVGPQGEQGIQGEQGPAGADGDDGSANVQSFVGSYTASDASYNSDNSAAWVLFSIDEMTTGVVQDGAVMAYYNDGTSTDNWTALPLSGESLEITYSYQEGFGEIDFISNDGTTVTEGEIPEGNVKFVLIPPSSSAKVKADDYANRVKEPGLRSKQ